MQILPGIITAIAIAAMLNYATRLAKQINQRGGCPECGTPVPAFRKPTSFRQAVWGGWTCSNCGAEMDRHGNEIPAQ
ncbi:MAG TPA: hypothetical protein VL327_01015 [Pyrinomonadaceae bacterium]|nr:hypothetical protein [Pyrinomonadaceae bacterium]